MSEDAVATATTGQAAIQDQVMGDVKSILSEVLGDEIEVDEVTPETSFSEDLQLESIEFVALSDFLQQKYEQVDFMAWMADMEFEQIMGLQVGQLVEFIASCLT